MASKSRTHLTDRDIELLTALDRCPLTVVQVLCVSQAFDQPFGSPSRVRGRMQALRQAGWVRRWQYATANRGGAPDYHKLTLEGYRVLHGQHAQAPTKRSFAEVGLAHQYHTQKLADFIVHTVVAAHQQGLHMVDFYRENTLRLTVGEECLFPDCAFRIRRADQQYNFVVELDNSSERVRSVKDADSWERKIRLYDQHQDQTTDRFRVLVVTTRSRERRDHILQAAKSLIRNPQRSLFYGVYLDDFLAVADAMFHPCFHDQGRQSVAMIPPRQPPLLSAITPLAHTVTAC
jgi:hypothetical protein